ncbi:hypothetical protein DFP92_1129 [Yoonia sediminilitoris]|uniref:Extensin-like C-terminal domain-containing protein n=2 Tax=Yoonia sediminilitoris TaxID=1286148 RepID=A0A2T6KA84_9RHOB|nr:hypothetical protein C8N45_1129 [Yoonia sediminilitoris]RCW91843.1 hypothetical protein DFP92_1129 [Yoonia sediminilitoris]
MAQEAAQKKSKKNGHPILRGLAVFAFLGLLGLGGFHLVHHPDTPLPPQWNPIKPLAISDPVTLLTQWKLDRTANDGPACLAALDGVATLDNLNDLETSDQCHIRDRVALAAIGVAGLDNIETRCAIALRLAMWEHHSLQPAAREFLGTELTGINHFGSYSCRAMRTLSGASSRMSTHATADAIDIAGFRFADGQSIQLIRDWGGQGGKAAFLRAARDGACDWFKLTLSPDYNQLHADHFHLQSTGWGSCR